MKLCKDCKSVDGGDEFCLSEKRPKVSLVTGETIPEVTCERMRSLEQYCGPDAKWFEPKAPDPGEGFVLIHAKDNLDEIVSINHQALLPSGEWSVDVEGVGQRMSQRPFYFYRRRITPELERCPEGHRPSLFQVEPGQFAIRCLCAGHRDHWRVDDTSEQMVRDRWNATMRAMRIASKLAEALRPLLDGIYSHSDFENAQKALKEWDSQNNP